MTKIQAATSDSTINLALDTIKIKKQALIFANTKRSAEKTAEEISNNIKESSKELKELSEQILHALSRPTKQCERLAKCVKKGAAFHHAGLTHKQKEIIEDNFRKGIIKIIACTPTLCISRDTKIWYGISETEVSKFNNSHPLFVLSRNKLISMKSQKVQRIENTSKLIQISSVSGYSIKVTPNHKMFVKRKGQKIILQAKNIKKTDKVATVGKLNIANIFTPSIKDFVIDNKINILSHKFGPKLSYLIGLMLGDGYSGAETNNGKIRYKGSPSIVGIDNEVFLQVSNFCKQLKINCRRTRTFHGTPQLILGKNKWFRELLVKCGVEKREKKHISKKLMKMNLENTASLLKGLFDTDGYVNKKLGIGFSNISEKLIKQIQKQLLRFGIVSTIRVKKAGSMNIYGKEYKTVPCFEINIHQKKSILDFYRFVGFDIKRKQEALTNLVAKICPNINDISCDNCRYKIYMDLFSGRTKEQKKWGQIKLKVIKLLAEKGELGSRELKRILGCEPKKKDSRLNHHYELIKKRRVGTRSKTEFYWSLNELGEWIYKNLITKNKGVEEFLKIQKCPLCRKELDFVLKKGWRDSDFDGDIFWDMIREIKEVNTEKDVYDIVLPNNPKNNHMFVANGFIVHNSFGLDLPAFRAIIKDLRRYGPHGLQWIPTLEYLQMAGRCVSKDTTVFTEKGNPIKISKIATNYFKDKETGKKEVKNLKILSVNLRTFKPMIVNVRTIWKRKVKKLLEIETRSGKIIRVSKEHPLLTFTKLNCGKARISKVFDNRMELYKKVMRLRKLHKWGENRISKHLGVFEKRNMIKHWFSEKVKPKKNVFIWKNANQIKTSKDHNETDYLASLVNFNKFDETIPLRTYLPKENVIQIDKNTFMTKQGHTKCNFPEDWSKNLCRFIAKIMSDGSIYYDKKDNSYNIRYFNKSKSVQQDYAKICLNLFNKKVSLKWRRGTYEANFKAYLVGKFLENIDIPSGKKSFILKMPYPIFTLPKKMIKSFFLEYVRCDGWETAGSYNIITSSKELAYDFASLLSKIGYIARVYKKKPNNWRKKEIWEISVTKSQFDCNKELSHVGNIYPDFIKNIKEINEEQYVYDLTLDKEHNFIANGLVIHNSGRPKFDKYGEAIAVVSTDAAKKEILDRYVNGSPEEIFSKLAVEPVLRTYVLSLIATGFVKTEKDMIKFFSKTFWAYQYQDMSKLSSIIRKMLHLLEEYEFIKSEEEKEEFQSAAEMYNYSYEPTLIGKRVAELYIDPLTAHYLIEAVKKAPKKDINEISFLQVISHTLEIRPLLRVRTKEYDIIQEELIKQSDHLLENEPPMYDPEYDDFLNSIKTALFFRDWINEKDEEYILETYNVRPGEIRVKLSLADWLLYASEELTRMLKLKDIIKEIIKIRLRLKHGIKEELLPLIKLENVGRVRARKLFNAGIKDIKEVKKAKITDLIQLLGTKVAFKIKEQVGQKVKGVPKGTRKGQVSIEKF